MSDESSADDVGTFSQVVVLGRLGSRIDRRALPSGDEVTTFTVVVDRDPRTRRSGGPAVDAIACQTFRAAIVRRLGTVAEGDRVRVEGVLRRRFWRSGSGLGSATEVEVAKLERVPVRR